MSSTFCSAWGVLVERYADGRPICNCGDAYYAPCGNVAMVVDGRVVTVTDAPVCKDGCSANQMGAKEEIAVRVLADLELIR